MEVQLKPLSIDNSEAFRNLLGSKDFGGCFCAVWTSYGEDWETRCKDKSQPNFHVTFENINSGKHVGYLVYAGESLVGWTGSGPKTAFPLLQTKSVESYPVRPFHEPRMYRGSYNLFEGLGFKVVAEEKDEEFDILLMEYLF